jgi:hypothetical protein
LCEGIGDELDHVVVGNRPGLEVDDDARLRAAHLDSDEASSDRDLARAPLVPAIAVRMLMSEAAVQVRRKGCRQFARTNADVNLRCFCLTDR